jgi:hypothetical protein
MKTGQWGRTDKSIEQVFIYNVPGDTFDSSSGTSFDSDTGYFDQVSPGNKVIAVFNTSHVLSTLDGTPASSDFTLHDLGSDDVVTNLTESILQYMQTPSTASIYPYYSMATGLVQSQSDTQSAYDYPGSGKNIFKLRQTGRWHRLKFAFTGGVKVTGYNVPLKTAGAR